ncbi:hypothetical protein BaRGS_00021409 [Batillaria attramentaria]|uniref:Uncharacterized protein n=1 Tax=Batillaria attramentaria TaxID=370345 RepID=A0ABD0KJE7_9CAEN
MKKTVDDLDAWYRQHIQQNRKYSAPTLPLTSRRSEDHRPPQTTDRPRPPTAPDHRPPQTTDRPNVKMVTWVGVGKLSFILGSEDDKVQHLTVPESDGPLTVSPNRTPSPTRKGRGRKSLPEGKLVVPGGNAEHLRRKSYDLAADSGKSTRLGLLLNRFNLPNM